MKPKVIRIERPALITEGLRAINWIVTDENEKPFDLRAAPRSVLQATVEFCQQNSLHGPTMVGNYIKAQQLLHGSLVHVDERVSRDLEISTVGGDLNQIAYPSEVMEIRFGDVGLPAILVCRIKNNSEMIGRGFVDSGIIFAVDTKAGATLTLSLPDTLWHSYVEGQFNEDMRAYIPEDMTMEDSEAELMRYMVLLAVKVLAYSSIPQFAPKLVATKAERKNVGVHPKHILANQSVFSVRYLPRLIRETEQTTKTISDKNNRFLGRAGYIRHYQDKRFVNVKGTWQWLPPIPSPEGIQVIYKIRKPTS